MDKRTEANWRKQLEFAYCQVDYWREMAFANKEELEWYRGVVEEAVARGAISVVDEDGNALIDVEEMEDEEDEEQLNVEEWKFPFNKKDDEEDEIDED